MFNTLPSGGTFKAYYASEKDTRGAFEVTAPHGAMYIAPLTPAALADMLLNDSLFIYVQSESGELSNTDSDEHMDLFRLVDPEAKPRTYYYTAANLSFQPK